VRYFEQRINEFERSFKENEQEKQELQAKLRDYERIIQQKSENE
jgi:cell shape-determining protein MreC